jgi:hypothetical protein
MRRSFRTPGDVGQGSQGVALGWYALPLRGKLISPACIRDAESFFLCHLALLEILMRNAD